MNIPFHRVTQELLATHELFRRLGFVPAELGPVAIGRQVLFQAAHGDLVFRADVAGGLSLNAVTEEEVALIAGEYPAAARWWNSHATPEEARMFVWLNSVACQHSSEIVLALARKGFPLAEMAEAKALGGDRPGKKRPA